MLRKWATSLPRIVPLVWFVYPFNIGPGYEVKGLIKGSIGVVQSLRPV